MIYIKKAKELFQFQIQILGKKELEFGKRS